MEGFFFSCFRKLVESEAQCDALREEVKQLKAEIEQWRVGGKSGSTFDKFPIFSKYCLSLY